MFVCMRAGVCVCVCVFVCVCARVCVRVYVCVTGLGYQLYNSFRHLNFIVRGKILTPDVSCMCVPPLHTSPNSPDPSCSMNLMDSLGISTSFTQAGGDGKLGATPVTSKEQISSRSNPS